MADVVGAAATERKPEPFRVRFKVPLTIIPPVAGTLVAVLLWDERARPAFFEAATHVLAIGAIALALQGRFFRLAPHRGAGPSGVYAGLNVLGVLVGTGVGLFFAFRALAVGHAGPADLAITAGALTTGICAFGVQAMFGTPGLQEEPEDSATSP